MKIIGLTEQTESLWDDFVESHPHSTMYHLIGWKRVFEVEFNYRSFYLAALNDSGKVEGILPMFMMQDIFRRKFLISNPFSNFAGICANSQHVKTLLFERAYEIAKEEGVQYIEFRQLARKEESDLPSKESFVNFMLTMDTDIESMWKRLKSRNRGKVRKAEREGLKVDYGKKYLNSFYNIFTRNLRRLGTPVFPISFFQTLIDEFPGNIEIFVANYHSTTVAAMFMFKFKNTIAEPWVASLSEYNRIYVNNFLYWQAIKYAKENGFEVFDFGRSTADSGTYHFKLQWGAEPVPLYYQYYLNKAQAIPVVDAHNNKYQKYINIWKNLPLTVTNFVGPKLVKYLPEL